MQNGIGIGPRGANCNIYQHIDSGVGPEMPAGLVSWAPVPSGIKEVVT